MNADLGYYLYFLYFYATYKMESANRAELLQRRKTTVSYTQSCLQPLQANL